MSRFYGTMKGGGKGESTRTGTVNQPLEVCAAGWQGCVRVVVYDKDGQDYARVELTTWKGEGAHPAILLHDGPINAGDSTRAACEAVIEWAKTPGNHGGNPYCLEFVQKARKALGIAD